MHYLEAVKTPRFEDYHIKYSNRNRFQYLGNGHSTAEQPGGDLSYYIRNEDDSPIDPILRKPGGGSTEEQDGRADMPFEAARL